MSYIATSYLNFLNGLGFGGINNSIENLVCLAVTLGIFFSKYENKKLMQLYNIEDFELSDSFSS